MGLDRSGTNVLAGLRSLQVPGCLRYVNDDPNVYKIRLQPLQILRNKLCI